MLACNIWETPQGAQADGAACSHQYDTQFAPEGGSFLFTHSNNLFKIDRENNKKAETSWLFCCEVSAFNYLPERLKTYAKMESKTIACN